MIKRTIFCVSLLMLALALGATSAQAQTEASKPVANTPSVKGSGTAGKITKWLDSRTIGNSVMTERTGNIGIGTTTPESKLTVEGAAELGVILRVTNIGAGGSGVLAEGGSSASGAGGEGVIAGGGDGSILAGDGVNAFGGTGPTGGNGVTAGGGNSRNGPGGVGVFARGGFGSNGVNGGNGGNGVGTFGGPGVGTGNRGGDGIFGRGGSGLFGATAGRAGFFDGDVDVAGTLTKGGGFFKIDHPLDPENRYLSHSFVESPDMMNVYNGNITTDQNGAAVVELPGWFEALNSDFRYQLTVIGAFAQAMVAEKIEGNRFTVRTSTPNVEVSWQVTGIRRDP